MQSFVLHENIRRFRDLLRRTVDPTQRATIEALLKADEAKLAALEKPPNDASADG